jgi:hypothetical protein
MRIQEHIGEVKNLYHKQILHSNQTATTPPIAHLQETTTQSSVVSLATQESDVHLEPSQSPAKCVVIDDESPPQVGLTMCLQSRTPLDNGSNNPIDTGPSPLVTFDNPSMAITTATTNETQHQFDAKQENCSGLVHHLFAHVKNIKFNTKAEVAKWCRSNIKVDILWCSNTINLMKTALTKVCRLCAAEHMIIGHYFNSIHQRKKIINLKSEQRGISNCKTRFLWFKQSN